MTYGAAFFYVYTFFSFSFSFYSFSCRSNCFNLRALSISFFRSSSDFTSLICFSFSLASAFSSRLRAVGLDSFSSTTFFFTTRVLSCYLATAALWGRPVATAFVTLFAFCSSSLELSSEFSELVSSASSASITSLCFNSIAYLASFYWRSVRANSLASGSYTLSRLLLIFALSMSDLSREEPITRHLPFVILRRYCKRIYL